MSKRSDDNAILRAIKMKISCLEYTEQELIDNRKFAIMLRDTSNDDRVRFNATKLINDTTIKINELRLQMEEYENPATQKIDNRHFYPEEIVIKTTQQIAMERKSNGQSGG